MYVILGCFLLAICSCGIVSMALTSSPPLQNLDMVNQEYKVPGPWPIIPHGHIVVTTYVQGSCCCCTIYFLSPLLFCLPVAVPRFMSTFWKAWLCQHSFDVMQYVNFRNLQTFVPFCNLSFYFVLIWLPVSLQVYYVMFSSLIYKLKIDIRILGGVHG